MDKDLRMRQLQKERLVSTDNRWLSAGHITRSKCQIRSLPLCKKKQWSCICNMSTVRERSVIVETLALDFLPNSQICDHHAACSNNSINTSTYCTACMLPLPHGAYKLCWFGRREQLLSWSLWKDASQALELACFVSLLMQLYYWTLLYNSNLIAHLAIWLRHMNGTASFSIRINYDVLLQREHILHVFNAVNIITCIQ